MGDPHSISIPISMISTNGTNNITLLTGTAPSNITEGSAENKIIFTIAKNISTYNTSIQSVAVGCSWNINFEDGSARTIKIPDAYQGANICTYTNAGCTSPDCNNNDAMQQSAYELLSNLDFNTNGKLDVFIDSNNLKGETFTVSGIPFAWQTEVQIRTWS